jgi:phage shock protein A
MSTSELNSSPPRGFAKQIRPVWLTPRRWLRRGRLEQRRQWAYATKGMLTPKSVMKKASLVFRYRASKFPDRREDSREILDYLYQQQLEGLTKARRAATDLARACGQVERQLEQLRQRKAELQAQAMRAQELDTEDIALLKEVQDQEAELESQYQELQAHETKLTTVLQQVQTKVEAFRTLNRVFKATYTATDAQREIGLMLYGLSKETSIIGMTMRRAQDRNTHMQARASMVNELTVPSTFDYVTGPPSTYIQPVLDRVDADIDAELELPKGEIYDGPASATGTSPADTKPASATDQPQTGNAHDRPNSQ